MLFPELDTPEVLLDLTALERNTERMAKLAKEAGLKLRPHTKTHKSPELAKLQLKTGATGITVAFGLSRIMFVLLQIWLTSLLPCVITNSAVRLRLRREA
jgi:hypothetical protein